MSSFINRLSKVLNEYNGTPAEVRAYRASKKGKKKLKGQNDRARKRRKKSNGGHDPEHAAHQRKYVERKANGGSGKKCSSCGSTSKRIEDHHPKGYKTDKTEPLCTTCHQKTKVPRIKSGMKKAKLNEAMITRDYKNKTIGTELSEFVAAEISKLMPTSNTLINIINRLSQLKSTIITHHNSKAITVEIDGTIQQPYAIIFTKKTSFGESVKTQVAQVDLSSPTSFEEIAQIVNKYLTN